MSCHTMLTKSSFDPCRSYEKEFTSTQKNAWGPFGGGTRICLGIHLAEMELRHGIGEFFLESIVAMSCRKRRLMTRWGWLIPS